MSLHRHRSNFGNHRQGDINPSQMIPGQAARAPAFFMSAMIPFALPMGVLSAISPSAARNIANGINTCLNDLPEPLHALFGLGCLGYTAERQ
jgi:hypothetical protein